MKIDDNTIGLLDLPNDVLNRIALNNRRIVEGTEEVLINPAYEDVDDVEIEAMVKGFLSSPDMTPFLVKIEEDQLSKLGPRSIAIPWSERRSSLVEYFGKETESPPRLDTTNRSKGRLVPASTEKAMSKLVKSSSAGLPYLKRKGLVLATESEQEILDGVGKYPCMLYTRTQESRKTRNVWGFPLADTVWEQQYHIPFLGLEKSLPFRRALLGPDHVDRAISDLFLRKRNEEVVHCVDFSSYDASISPALAHRAFEYIASTFQDLYKGEIDYLYERFISIPIVTPDGVMSGHHGVPSGSSFTNTVDSLVQWQIATSQYDHKCQIQGDDGVYLVRDRDVEAFNESFISAGLKLNTDKSETFSSHEGVFLQRYYHPNYTSDKTGLGGVYSIARALNRIKYLERWTDFEKEGISGPDFFALRTIMILENCKHHPHFVDVVKFALAQDKYDLTYSEAGLKSYSRMMESKVRAGVVNQFGDAGGIQNFETVKLLTTL